MDINWTLVTIAGALLAQGAAVVWAVSSMVSDIKYNMNDIEDMRTSMEILEDLVVYGNQKEKNINNLFIIFTKEDRLMYIGILLFMISIALWLIEISK